MQATITKTVLATATGNNEMPFDLMLARHHYFKLVSNTKKITQTNPKFPHLAS